MKKTLFFVALILTAVMLLCSCAAGKADTPNDFPEVPGGPEYDGNYNDAGGGKEDLSGIQSDSIPGSVTAGTQKLIKTVEMSLETTEFDKFTENLSKSLSDVQGYIENSSVYASTYRSLRSGKYALRVPADRLEEFVERLKGDANLLNYKENSTDVSLEYADLEGKLTALRAEQTALNTMLEKAVTVSECIELQNRLSEVRGEIESIEGRLRVLSSKVSYSTVTVTIEEVEKVTVIEKKQTVWQELSEKFNDNASSVNTYLRGLFVNIVGGTPTLLAIFVTVFLIFLPPVLLVLIIVLIVKGAKKRKAKKQQNKNT